MVMDKRMESFASIRAALSLPVAPLHYLIHWPGKVIANIKVTLSTHDDLVQENLHLKTEQLLLRSQLQRLLAIESENNYLKSLLRSSKQIKGKTLIAEILSVASEPFVHHVVLNKGSRDKVYVGQPVLDANGVMGQVVEVGPLTSRVLLINDPHSGISVQNARNGLRAIAVGDTYNGKLRLSFVAKTADIRKDDIYMTSGLSERYPEGYPVGRVESVDNDPTQQFALVELMPSAHLASSRQVLLVWYQRNA
jgi:rod shape-determining protein MreC